MITINQMLAELENKAEAATPGPWTLGVDEENDEYEILFKYKTWTKSLSGVNTKWEHYMPQHKSESEFIVAANPQTVLTLIAIIKQQNEALLAVVSSRFLPPQANVLSTYIKVEQALTETERMIKEIK